MAVAQAAMRRGGAQGGSLFAYAGSYTEPIDGGGNGSGIYRFEVNPRTGELTKQKVVSNCSNPSWIVIHPSKKYLYAINEILQKPSGTVTAFAIDGASGDLTSMGAVSSEGIGPAHMSLDRSGKFAFVANYWAGTIAVLPIMKDGKLGAAVDVHHDEGSVGAKHATNAPPGSFAISGHDKPHAHMIVADPDNRFVLNTDLGQDRIYIYSFDAATGKLSPVASQPFVSFPAGDGPRHLTFHPNGRWVYVVGEESSTIAFYHYDDTRGALDLQQSISSLPAGFAGTNYTSEIVVSADGRFLYVANRLHDTIAICSITSDGRVKLLTEIPTMGDYPRHCTFDPSGDFFYVCNQRSDHITCFKTNKKTGLLTFTGQYTPVGSPTILTFLA